MNDYIENLTEKYLFALQKRADFMINNEYDSAEILDITMSYALLINSPLGLLRWLKIRWVLRRRVKK